MQGLCRVVSFHTTFDALFFQAECKRRELPGRLMPIPRQLSAGCGLAWQVPIEQAALLNDLLTSDDIGIEAVTDLIL